MYFVLREKVMKEKNSKQNKIHKKQVNDTDFAQAAQSAISRLAETPTEGSSSLPPSSPTKPDSELDTLRLQNTQLEDKLKDLRLKAKLKITQLQRELDAAKQIASTTTATTPSNPKDTHTTDSLPAKVSSTSTDLVNQSNPSISQSTPSLPAPSDPTSNDAIEALRNSLTAAEDRANALHHDLVGVQRTLSDTRDELDAMRVAKEGVEARFREVVESVPPMGREKELEMQVESLQSEASALRAEVAFLKGLEGVVKVVTAEKDALVGRVEAVEVEKERLEEDVRLANADRELLELQVQRLEENARRVGGSDAVGEGKEGGAESNDSVRELTTVRGQLAESHCRVEELQHSLAALQTDSSSLHTTNQSLETRVTELTHTLAERDAAITRLESSHEDLQTELQQTRLAVVDLETRVHTLLDESHAARAERDQLMEEVTTLKDERDTAQQKVMEVQHQLQAQRRRSSSVSPTRIPVIEVLTSLKDAAAAATADGGTALKEEVRESKAARDVLENRVSGLLQELEDTKARVCELESLLTAATVPPPVQHVTNNNTNTTLTSLQDELESIKQDRDAAHQKVLELHHQLQTRVRSSNSRSPSRTPATPNSTSDPEFVALTATLATTRARVQELESMLDSGIPRADTTDVSLIHDLQESERALRRELKQVKADRDTAQKYLVELHLAQEERDRVAAEGGEDSVKELLEEMRGKLVDSEAGRNEVEVVLEETRGKLVDLEAARKEVESLLTETRTKLEDSESVVSSLQMQLLETSTTLRTTTDEKSKLLLRCMNTKDELDMLKEVLAQKDEDLVEVQTRLGAVQKEVEEANAAGAGQDAFLVDEQVRDLKVQIAARQREVAGLTEVMQKSKADFDRATIESESKIRRLKGLLGQASKTLQESKRAVSEKDHEIEQLHAHVDALEATCHELKAREGEQRVEIERLVGEVAEEREVAGMKVGELERQSATTLAELTRLKTEFQSYKVKAHTALQQQSSGNQFDAKLAELQHANDQLLREKMESTTELHTLQSRVDVLTTQLTTTVDQLVSLETQLLRHESIAKQLALLRHDLESAHRRAEVDKRVNAEAVRHLEGKARQGVESVRGEMGRETSTATGNFASVLAAAGGVSPSGAVSPSLGGGLLGSAGLLSAAPVVPLSPGVTELLAEAEEEIRRLVEDQKVLKEEIRKGERAESGMSWCLVKRQNVKYLKNVVLSFLETGAKEQLLPVISKVLELSPDAVKRVQSMIAGMEDTNVQHASPSGSGIF
ncbi:hypothetical protein HDU98_006293 [Podochytrium sp. JEL0797]|nr:hypothetical protein HDU98_006293 [Podochytrium sp. JEL0797]